MGSLLRPRRLAATLALAAVTGGCRPAPVQWQGTSVHSAAGAGAWSVAITADGRVVPDSVAALAAAGASPEAAACPGSLRVAGRHDQLVAVWWSPRSDSSARLRAARSRDGGRHWSAPASVDTTDESDTGCRREPPAIAFDSASGYVHVTYGLRGAEGPGLFFAHSMDGGATFHSPVPILYGEHLGRTSVAADGDVVVVGFEDPNSAVPRVGLALSRTMGHIFEARIVPVSDDAGAAVRPHVAVSGRQIAVGWERRAEGSASSVIVLRRGWIP